MKTKIWLSSPHIGTNELKYVNEAFSIVDETIGTENAKRILFGSSHPYAPAYKTLNNSKATRNFFPAIFSLIVLILVLLSFYFFKFICFCL